MTYAALSAGYRGLAFHGDADLTREARAGCSCWRWRLLNAEIDLCESILANGADPIPIYSAFDPDPSTIPPPGSPIARGQAQEGAEAARRRSGPRRSAPATARGCCSSWPTTPAGASSSRRSRRATT